LIFGLFAGIGAVMLLGGAALKRYGSAEVGNAIVWIGAVCLAGGFFGEVSVLSGGPSFPALLAVAGGALALVGPSDGRVGSALISLGLAVEAVNELPGLGVQSLTTIAVIAVVLGIASVLNNWLRRKVVDQHS
jgi:hypothetical protein